MDVDFLMSQIELRESLEVIKTTKDEMALEDFIVNITGKVVATAAFSFSIWIVKFKAFIQPFFNKIHFGAI
jgi:hypothetical protein